ncbi:MAG: RtcB family protein [Clostridia bacterium]|nr:RtcB family protein [Clostridia bacterium]
MIELQGKYNMAKVFTDTVDNACISQIIELLNQPMAEGSVIRMMPDCHAGSGCTVGTTMTVGDKIIPSIVGVDIGCGMHVVKLKDREIDCVKLDALIRAEIPSGMEVRKKAHPFLKEVSLQKLCCFDRIDQIRAELSIGTLGGGNHFIEVDRAEDGTLYLVIHSGSRYTGKQVAEYYQNLGYHRLNGSDTEAEKRLIESLRAKGQHKKIEDELKKLKNTKRTSIPKDLCYVTGSDLDDYLCDMQIMQQYADVNRRAMASVIVKGLSLKVDDTFTTVHNYIDVEEGVLRKGAVSAKEGEVLLIPINMRDGSLICRGKGNPDWNRSAPHGAGRLMSRGEARSIFTVDEYREAMRGIYTTSVGYATLDESPMAYKPIEEILENITPTVDVLDVIKPVYNFKASDL